MIGGLIERKFIAPMTFNGGCDNVIFNLWLEQILLPQLSLGTTIVMDNAAFHKNVKTKELIEGAGCHLLYLPTYSPDLNPIEHCWHKVKSILKSLAHQQHSNLHDILNTCLLNIQGFTIAEDFERFAYSKKLRLVDSLKSLSSKVFNV